MIRTIFLIMLAVSLSLTGCNSKGDQQETPPEAAQTIKIKQVNADDFEQMLNQHPNAQLIDVRTAQEFAGGYLDNARNINYHDPDFKTKVAKLKKDEPVFVYCAVGGRSAAAAKVLQGEGFTYVIDLTGGITDWKRKDKNVKQD